MSRIKSIARSPKFRVLAFAIAVLAVSCGAMFILHNHSEVFLVLRDQHASIRNPATTDAPNLELHENYGSLLYEVSKELLILGLLVFIWEILHEKFKQKQIEENQISSLIELLFFVDEVKPHTPAEQEKNELPSILKSKFYNEVCTAYEDIKSGDCRKIHALNINFSEADLSTFSSESLLYNVEETLNAIQDIIIEGQEKDSALHAVLLSVYKEVRLLTFLVKRFSCLQERDSMEARDHKVLTNNKINILIGVCYSLNRIQRFVANLKGLRDGEEADVQNLCISRSVLVRVASAMKYEINDESGFFAVYQMVKNVQESHRTDERVFIADPNLRSLIAYFIALREYSGTKIKPSKIFRHAS